MSRAPSPTGPPSAARTAVEQDVPQALGLGRIDEDLEPVLAGVAGPRDQRRDAGDGPLGGGVVAQRRQVDVGQRPEDLGGAWTLDGQQPGRQRPVVEDRLEALESLGEGVGDDRGVAGVGDDQEAVLAQAIDDQVVDDPAVGGAHHRVVGATDGQARRVGDERRRERQAGFGALDEELAHVRQVEQPDPFADGPVLLDDRAVLDRHQPATEFDQPRAERAVGVGQRASGGSAPRVRRSRRGLGAGRSRALARVRPASSAARATSARSVSKVSIVAAWSNGIQRTSSNSWSCPARSPPTGSIRK